MGRSSTGGAPRRGRPRRPCHVDPGGALRAANLSVGSAASRGEGGLDGAGGPTCPSSSPHAAGVADTAPAELVHDGDLVLFPARHAEFGGQAANRPFAIRQLGILSRASGDVGTTTVPDSGCRLPRGGKRGGLSGATTHESAGDEGNGDGGHGQAARPRRPHRPTALPEASLRAPSKTCPNKDSECRHRLEASRAATSRWICGGASPRRPEDAAGSQGPGRPGRPGRAESLTCVSETPDASQNRRWPGPPGGDPSCLEARMTTAGRCSLRKTQ